MTKPRTAGRIADDGQVKPRSSRGRKPGPTRHYAARREAVIAAATDILNTEGLKGMTRAKVAARVGLTKASMAYYFKRNDELAATCFLRAIAEIDALILKAGEEADPDDRIRSLVEGYLQLWLRVRLNEAPPIAYFGDIRVLAPSDSKPVTDAYVAMFRHARSLLDSPTSSWMSRRELNARTFLLVTQLNSIIVWLGRFEPGRHARIAERVADILIHGFSGSVPSAWPPRRLQLPERAPSSRETFLIATTRLINLHGYHGASVDMISSELRVTKGAFYHHNDDKTDLVSRCFERTFSIITEAQDLADRMDLRGMERLEALCLALAEYQLQGGVLLGTNALSALPVELMAPTLAQSHRASDRFVSMICDGFIDGSIRPLDAMIGAGMVAAGLQGVAELQLWIPELQIDELTSLYLDPMLHGVTRRSRA